MRALAIALLMAAAASAGPLDLEVYRSQVGGKPVVLVPVPGYRQLLDVPAPPPSPSPAPPAELPDRVDRADVGGAVRDGRAELAFTIDADLGGRRLRTVPLLAATPGLVITRFRGPGELVRGQGASVPNAMATTHTGSARVELAVVLPVQRVEQSWRLAVPLPPAPRQTVELDLPGADLNVRAEQGLLLSSATRGGATRVRASGAGGPRLVLRWTPAAQVRAAPEASPAEPDLTPDLSVQVATLATASDTHLKMKSTLSITVKRNPVHDIVLAAHASASFVDVSGPLVAEWESAPVGGLQLARVTLRGAVQDRIDLAVEYEMPVGDPKAGAAERLRASFIPVHVPAAYQEEHALGVARPPNLDLDVTPGAEWRELDPARMPANLAQLAGQTLARLLQCERFPRASRAEPPAAIELQCRRLDEVKLLQATVDLMEATTALTEDGHLLGRVTYRVRNNSQQFLSLKPPRDARPLTVYVAGKAVRAASDAEGRWLIPLGKSGRTPKGAAPFEVQVTYLQELAGGLAAGRALDLSLPAANLGISTIRWTVAIPKEWTLSCEGGNMRAEASYRPVVFASDDAQAASAPAALFDESTLPLAVELPKIAEAYHFSQDLLDKDAEARTVRVVLGRSTHELTRRAAAFLIGVLFFYVVLRRRPEGRARVVATAAALIGTGLLMALFGWASSTLGLTLHLALGLFMGTVIFGVSRFAAGVASPAVGPEEE